MPRNSQKWENMVLANGAAMKKEEKKRLRELRKKNEKELTPSERKELCLLKSSAEWDRLTVIAIVLLVFDGVSVATSLILTIIKILGQK